MPTERFIPETENIEPPPKKAWKADIPGIPKDLELFVPEVEQFIADYQELFRAIAGDRTLRFVAGSGFYINLLEGIVTLDVRDWKLAKEKGLSVMQQVWSVCHELAHFRDLREAPKEMLDNFTYLEARARELTPQVLEIWKRKCGGNIPKHLTTEVPIGSKGDRTMPMVTVFIYKKLHLLYNSEDDVYVNQELGLRSAMFGRGGSQQQEVERLYRDYLFPTNPKAMGSPPQPHEACDLAGVPKSAQLAYAPLRRTMVPGQPVLLAPEVEAILQGYADATAQRLQVTLEKEIQLLTSPGNPRAKRPGWRYDRIKKIIEPIYLKLYLEDLEDLPPPSDPKKQEQQKKDDKKEGEEKEQENDGEEGEDGEPGEESQSGKPKEGKGESEGEPQEDPWGELDDKSEPIDLDTIKDFIAQQKEKDKQDKEKKAAAEREARLTPEERDAKAEGERDAALINRHAKPGDNTEELQRAAKEYRELQRSIEPYARDLAAVFERLLRSISERVTRFWLEGFRSGKFNVDRYIHKYAPEHATGALDAIPWETLDVYDQKEFISRLVLFPDHLRLRLVLDGSGSVNAERLLALKQMAVLALEGLSTFEATTNLRFRLKDPLVVDTEIRMFGDPGKSEVIKSSAAGAIDPEAEAVERFRAYVKIKNTYGSTCDAEPFWNIADSMDGKHVENLKRGRAKELVVEVTDGGSNMLSQHGRNALGQPGRVVNGKAEAKAAAQDTRNAIEAVKNNGAICRGLQIGEPDAGERTTFDKVWGQEGAHVPHPKDLPQQFGKILEDEFQKIEFQIQYYGEDEE